MPALAQEQVQPRGFLWFLEKALDRIAGALERTRPNRKYAVVVLERLTTSLRSWQRVAEWVPLDPGGVLKQVGMTADPNARYRLIVEGRETFVDKSLASNLNLDFQRMQVQGLLLTRVEIRSVDGSSITVDASIHGEQKLTD